MLLVVLHGLATIDEIEGDEEEGRDREVERRRDGETETRGGRKGEYPYRKLKVMQKKY